MTTPTPILLLGGMGVGKSEILKRFHEEQPFMLFATVRSMVAETPPDGETRSADPTDWIIDDIGTQFGLPDRSIVERIISSQFDVSFSDRKALERLRTAILRGIGWFRIFYPNKFAHIVLDEVTFLIPNPADPEAVKASKRSCFEQLQALAVLLGHEFRSCRVVMSSSSPEILQMMEGDKIIQANVPPMLPADSIKALLFKYKHVNEEFAATILSELGTLREAYSFLELHSSNPHSILPENLKTYSKNAVVAKQAFCTAISKNRENETGLDNIAREWRTTKPFKVSSGDKEAYKIMIRLHRASILSINGITDEITFPHPAGRIAFEQMIQDHMSKSRRWF